MRTMSFAQATDFPAIAIKQTRTHSPDSAAVWAMFSLFYAVLRVSVVCLALQCYFVVPATSTLMCLGANCGDFFSFKVSTPLA